MRMVSEATLRELTCQCAQLQFQEISRSTAAQRWNDLESAFHTNDLAFHEAYGWVRSRLNARLSRSGPRSWPESGILRATGSLSEISWNWSRTVRAALLLHVLRGQQADP